ncbi:MAG: M23 family metallopeptidase [Candidatus Egerieousia sp.]
MAGKKRYVFNTDTLAYDLQKIPLLKRLSKGMALFLLSLVVFAGYYIIYTKVLKLDTPKTIALRQTSARLYSKIEVVRERMEDVQRDLEELQVRDNNVYRPIFGMEAIPAEDRNSSYGDSQRYTHLSGFPLSSFMIDAEKSMDLLYKKAYVQSVSFDAVAPVAGRANSMASCVPAIPPVFLNRVRLTSRFGVRSDPMSGAAKVHSGLDLAGHSGEPVYATGDGVVVEASFAFFGYGNVVIIDHGFGYKTRYAHLKRFNVRVGDRVSRGDEIAAMGSTGKSTGNHLHYEVEYMGRKVNPLNYFNINITPSEYERLVESR